MVYCYDRKIYSKLKQSHVPGIKPLAREARYIIRENYTPDEN